MSPLAAAPPARVSRPRLWAFGAGMLLFTGYVTFTLHDLQVTRSAAFQDLVRRQHEQVIQIDPRRGSIFDRTGRELALSTDVFSVYAAPQEIDAKDADRAVAGLASALSLSPDQIRAKLASEGFVLLKRRAAPDVADRVRDLRISGLHLVAESKRFYPRASLAAHVLGFVVPDEPALREGLEKRYDAEIRGTPGAMIALRDATGSHFLVQTRTQPEPGRDLVTSIDEVIQHLAERELADAIESTGSKAGSVVVLHTPTGEILAIANWPTFNPNLYRLSGPSDRRDRAVTDMFEPGSTFKLITAAAALEEGLVRPSEVIDCGNGVIHVAGITIHDHKRFGLLSFREVISESSDVGSIKVGMRLDARTFHDYIAGFGFGAATGVDLPGESRGLLRPVARWAATSGAYISFGQEIGATPIQMATAFSTVANRGVLVAPRVVLRIGGAAGGSGRQPERQPPRRVLRESTADVLVDLLEGVVTEGTGKRAAIPGYRVAGKTGTAQKIVNKVYSPDKFVASFAGFVPSRRPVLTILVLLDEPSGSIYHGGDVAAPVFRRIAEPALDYLGVPRDADTDPPVALASLGAGRQPVLDAAAGSPPAPVVKAAMVTPRAWPRGKGKGASAAPAGPKPVAPHPLDLTGGRAPRSLSPGSGPAPEGALVQVPDLSGAPMRDAVVALARGGLRATARGEGFVVTQDPPPGSLVAAGTPVNLVLGRFVEEIPAPTVAAATHDH